MAHLPTIPCTDSALGMLHPSRPGDARGYKQARIKFLGVGRERERERGAGGG